MLCGLVLLTYCVSSKAKVNWHFMDNIYDVLVGFAHSIFSLHISNVTVNNFHRRAPGAKLPGPTPKTRASPVAPGLKIVKFANQNNELIIVQYLTPKMC